MSSQVEDTQTLWRSFRASPDDKALRDRLILTYAPLVKYVAGRLGTGLPAHVDEGDLVSKVSTGGRRSQHRRGGGEIEMARA